MIDEVSIQNFRCFREIRVNGIRRINVIVGDNGAGKTALIEALYLAACSTPQFAMNLRSWRGMPVGGTIFGQNNFYQSLWGDLFYNFDLFNTIEISLSESDQTNIRTLRMFRSNEPSIVPLNSETQQSGTFSPPVTFEWTTPYTSPIKVTPSYQPPGGLSVPPTPDGHLMAAFIALRDPVNPFEVANNFSALSKRGEGKKFIELMKKQFPEIDDISIELEMGMPMLFVKLSWAKQKRPINILSDGMSRIACVCLSIATCQGGAIFVDEIESGLYFQRQSRFWQQITEFSDYYRTQIFATTHSEPPRVSRRLFGLSYAAMRMISCIA